MKTTTTAALLSLALLFTSSVTHADTVGDANSALWTYEPFPIGLSTSFTVDVFERAFVSTTSRLSEVEPGVFEIATMTMTQAVTASSAVTAVAEEMVSDMAFWVAALLGRHCRRRLSVGARGRKRMRAVESSPPQQ